MLDYNIALELLQKYGFSSTEHPYIFFNEPHVGLCYVINDENYGRLERKKLFTDITIYEEFLKKLAWMRDNSFKYNVKMVLDNYEIEDPKIMFLRDNRPMLIGEMFNIEAYDERNEKKKELDKNARLLYEIGDLILVYDEIKIRQLNEMNLANSLRNELRKMYFELQKEVNFYNKVDVELNLTLLAEIVVNNGINEVSEVALKDRYNLAKTQTPTEAELLTLLEETWDLLKGLESNERFYETCIEVKEIRNEMALVQAKIDLMNELNEDPGAFKIDLMSSFRKINADFEENKTFIYDGYIQSKLDNINKKYAAYESLDKNGLADFLRESLENNDYDELMSRFVKSDIPIVKTPKLPVSSVISILTNQYQALSVAEQAVLILSNSPCFGELMRMINSIPNYQTLPVSELIGLLSKFKGFSSVKSTYELIKSRVDLADNASIKQSVFANFNFTSFDAFLNCLVTEMSRLKAVDKRMVINSDVTLVMKEFENLECYDLIFLSNNYEKVKEDYDYKKNIIGSFTVKCGVPVLFSPYYLDFGNIYDKGKKDATMVPFSIQVNPYLNLMVDSKSLMISRDDFYVTVADYESNPTVSENVLVVSKIKNVGKHLFCKASVLDNVSAARVRSILSLTDHFKNADVVAETAVAYSQPVVQQIVDSTVVAPSVPVVAQPAPVQQPVVQQPVVQQLVAPQMELPQLNNSVPAQMELPQLNNAVPAQMELPQLNGAQNVNNGGNS